MPKCTRLEIDLKLTANGWAQTIKELAKAWAAWIVLHVAPVEVGDVKDGGADAHLVFLEHWNTKSLGDLHVK